MPVGKVFDLATEAAHEYSHAYLTPINIFSGTAGCVEKNKRKQNALFQPKAKNIHQISKYKCTGRRTREYSAQLLPVVRIADDTSSMQNNNTGVQ